MTLVTQVATGMETGPFKRFKLAIVRGSWYVIL